MNKCPEFDKCKKEYGENMDWACKNCINHAFREPVMKRQTILIEAHTLFNEMGADPQVAFAVLQIAKAIDNDPQVALTLLAIAKYLTGEK